MSRKKVSRREFIQQTAALAGTAWLASTPSSVWAQTPPRYAHDQVPLGKTGIKLSRLGFGTGSDNGRVLRNLGMDQAVRLLRYAYDLGNGAFTRPEDRERSIRFVMQPGLVDAVVIGFKSTAEVDEAIKRINKALAAQPA